VNSSAFKRGTCNKQGQPGTGSKLFYINWWGYDFALQPSAPQDFNYLNKYYFYIILYNGYNYC
jgi:hypothetical protein